MQLRNTQNQYGLISRVFHWLMGIALLATWVIGFALGQDWFSDKTSSGIFRDWHKATGVCLLFAVVLRVLWRQINIRPQVITQVGPRRLKVIHWNTVLLYILMFAFPISGILMSLFGGHNIGIYGFLIWHAYGKYPWSHLLREIHEICGYLFFFSVFFHISGALLYYWQNKIRLGRLM